MSDRIYTIPARDVLPRMKLRDGKRFHDVVYADDNRSLMRIIAGPLMLDVDPEDFVSIMLPGPSPRELLCDCALADPQVRGQHSDPENHLFTCPVYRLSLRLWPVGATWDGDAWVVPVGDETVRVEPDDVREEWWRGDVADDLRAAFCEPEVTT